MLAFFGCYEIEFFSDVEDDQWKVQQELECLCDQGKVIDYFIFGCFCNKKDFLYILGLEEILEVIYFYFIFKLLEFFKVFVINDYLVLI